MQTRLSPAAPPVFSFHFFVNIRDVLQDLFRLVHQFCSDLIAAVSATFAAKLLGVELRENLRDIAVGIGFQFHEIISFFSVQDVQVQRLFLFYFSKLIGNIFFLTKIFFLGLAKPKCT